MKQVYLGIDLGSKVCAAAARDEQGEIIDSEIFPTSARGLISFVERQDADVHVLFEEGELASWAYSTLLPHALEVKACDARHNRLIYQGPKDDLRDARDLSELSWRGKFREVHKSADPETAAFKLVVKRHQQLVRAVARQKVRIKAYFRAQGLIFQGTAIYGAAGRKNALSLVQNDVVRDVLEREYAILDSLDREKAYAKQTVIRLCSKLPVIASLRRMPGCDYVTAARFVAYVEDPGRFHSRSAFMSYCRLAVLHRESNGKQISRERLDRCGVGALKDTSRKVFDAARRRKDDNGIKRSYEASLERTGNKTHARLSTQRKILWAMLVIWRDGRVYDDKEFEGAKDRQKGMPRSA